MKTLDLDAVQTFALTASLMNFTRVAEATGTTQSAVSLKLKRLETFLGKRLLERTPRSVRLTDDGSAFLDHARELLAANERALAAGATPQQRLRLGFSDHAAGPELPRMLGRLYAADPSLTLDITVGLSQSLLDVFDKGKLDAVIVRQEANRRGGEALIEDEFAWFAATSFEWRQGQPLRVASLAAPCGVRAIAIRALDGAGVQWNEAFVAGGVAAAVSAGVGVAALARRIAPIGSIDVGPKFKLPKLPRTKAMLYSRVSDARSRAALRTLAAALRGMTGS